MWRATRFGRAVQHLSALRASRAQIFSVRSCRSEDARPLSDSSVRVPLSAVFVSSAGAIPDEGTQHLLRLSLRGAKCEAWTRAA